MLIIKKSKGHSFLLDWHYKIFSMRTKHIIVLLSFFVLCFFSTDTYAQRGKPRKSSKSSVDKAFENDGDLMSKLWFGGMVQPGFSGNANINQFVFGLTPMVGYKISDKLSVGPRIALNYTHIRGIGSPDFGFTVDNYRANLMSTSFALFGRYKIIPAIFAHVEYENQQNKFYYTLDTFIGAILAIDPITDEVLIEVERRSNAYVGLGYTTTGTIFNTEVTVLYNVLEDPNSIRIPISFRFGLNYNF